MLANWKQKLDQIEFAYFCAVPSPCQESFRQNEEKISAFKFLILEYFVNNVFINSKFHWIKIKLFTPNFIIHSNIAMEEKENICRVKHETWHLWDDLQVVVDIWNNFRFWSVSLLLRVQLLPKCGRPFFIYSNLYSVWKVEIFRVTGKIVPFFSKWLFYFSVSSAWKKELSFWSQTK